MWRRRSPAERREWRIEFLGEQDGLAEEELKVLLRSELRRFPSIQRAYLARLGFAPEAPVSVGLCVASSAEEELAIIEAVQRTFSALFADDSTLDVLFLNAEQEVDLRRVRKPFLGDA